MKKNWIYDDLYSRALCVQRDGVEIIGPWSTGEQLAVLLIVNRADVINKMGYTILQAVERVGDEWMREVFAVARDL
jgi:hypothetical protein